MGHQLKSTYNGRGYPYLAEPLSMLDLGFWNGLRQHAQGQSAI